MPPPDEFGSIPEPVILATLAAPAPGARPRIWTAILAPLITIVVATGVSGALTFVGALAMHPDGFASLQHGRPPDNFAELLIEFLNTPVGLAVMLLPQGFMFAAAILAAWLSPDELSKRLSLGRSQLGPGTVLLCLMATPFISEIGSLLIDVLGGPSESLQHIERLFRDMRGPAFLAMTLGISILPGICEELLFRGYLQTRLLQAMPAWRAIAISSVMFAFAHVDPKHAVAVIPMGVWLGVVAWVGRSIWPAVVCHLINNLASALSSHLTEVDDPSVPAIRLALALVSGVAWLAAIAMMIRTRRMAGATNMCY